MRRIFKNTLFIKICLSFWLTTLFMIGAVVTVDWLAGTGPFHAQRSALPAAPLVVQGQAFAWILEHEGEAALRNFAGRLQGAAGSGISFFDEQGRELTGAAASAGAPPPLATPALPPLSAPAAGFPPPDGRGRTSLLIVGSGGKSYRVSARVSAEMAGRPPHPPRAEPLWGMTGVRILVVLTVSGLICYLLARYLTAPILKLGAAARQVAAGDLSVRVGPGLGRRKDEISRLALDFDLMAERIESLMNHQRILLRDISHELRSPLARLNVALELCRKGCRCGTEKLLGRIERESERLNDMIGHLLTLNRVESGISPVEKKKIDLADLIREIVEDADFEAKGLNRAVRAGLIEPCFVEGDEELLRRALENVARNAVRYTPDGSEVDVSLCAVHGRDDSRSLITVRDHGMGVPEAAIPHLFRPFYRVGDGRERETGGSGLGLAITEAAVRLHGGTVRAENHPGGGLVVEVSLPALS